MIGVLGVATATPLGNFIASPAAGTGPDVYRDWNTSPFTAHLGHYSRYTFACISTIDIAQTCAITRAKR